MDSRVDFIVRHLSADEVAGRSVLEAGSNAVAGRSARGAIEQMEPRSYVGVDLETGPNVNVICDAEDLVERFGEGSFDIVVSTEMLEHVRDWRKVVSNLKRVCAPNGVILITTRSNGFPYHAWPADHWRYEPQDMEAIFADCDIRSIERDPEAPGVFVKVTTPSTLTECDLEQHELFSMVKQRRTRTVKARDEKIFAIAYAPVRLIRAAVPSSLKHAVKKTPLSRERRIQRENKRWNDQVRSRD